MLFTSSMTAQDVFEEQYNLANNLFDKENYFDAVTEYKRLLFFDESGKYDYQANFKMGLCFKYAVLFDEAINSFSVAEILSTTGEEVYQARLELIKINILRRTTARAFNLLDSLQSDPIFFTKEEEINYWRGWTYIFSDDWVKASEVFSEVSHLQPLAEFCDSVANEKYDVTLVKLLSLVPGAGQFYTGEYINGLLSLGWNVLWGYLAINAFSEDRVFDGLMISSLLWWRFYSGNIQNAEKFAIEKNHEITNSALRNLQSNYNGLNP